MSLTCPFWRYSVTKSRSILTGEVNMILRLHHGNFIYVIELPPGSRIHRSERAGESVVFLRFEEAEVPVFEKPPELLIELARAGRYGMKIVQVEKRSRG